MYLKSVFTSFDYSNEKMWLVVMEKLEDTKTNESRKDVRNTNRAKFRADKLKVIKIFDMDDIKKTIDCTEC